MPEFAKRRSMTRESSYPVIYEVVRAIPRGRVATYGQVARLAGLGRSARLVGYALHALPDGNAVPWQRVVNASGGISPRAEAGPEALQRVLLEREGIVFGESDRLDLARFQWKPGHAVLSRLRRGLPRRERSADGGK